MADFHVAHRMHTYTIIPRVLYVRRWGLKRWSLAFGKSGRVLLNRAIRSSCAAPPLRPYVPKSFPRKGSILQRGPQITTFQARF
ncbi:MAG: hypothetical protein L6R39_005013 [Caloplaca ligustica]|nr:MAG: hypothetical protein L6R39_005013 [Caloplaca ligustica]